MNAHIYGLLPLALAVLTAGSAQATTCGDDVDGARIACACGDTVVSDTRLRIDDPVVMRRCESNGLLIRAASGADSISVDLDGLSIAGSGSGTGITVIRGGKLGATINGGTDGALGQILGFRTGITARGTNTLAHLANVQVESNTRTGVAVHTNAATLSNVIAIRNNGDGIRLGGHGIDARGLEARLNSGTGIMISGRDHRFKGIATENDKADVSQRGHREMRSAEVSQ